MKEENLDRAKFIFRGNKIKITINGQRQLGAAIGSKEFKREYIESMLNNWSDQLIHLSKIAEMEPQLGFKSIYNF